MAGMGSVLFLGLSLAYAQAEESHLRGSVSHAPDYQQCGVLGQPQKSTPGTPSAKIVHGRDAGQCVWRWQVSIGDARSGQFCGGTLVAPNWVLTAAHCVSDIRSACKLRTLKIGAGTWKREFQVEVDRGTGVERLVKKVFLHPMYEQSVKNEYDFALLQLDKAVPLNECIGTACLPSAEEKSGSDCRITGWGTLRSSGPIPEVLQEAPVSILSREVCETNYSRTQDVITASMLCASGHTAGGVTDTCQGDSGGPLVCEEEGRYVIQGVTSWGQGCAYPNFPGVYSRVQSVLAWLRDVMAGKVEKASVKDEETDLSKVNFNGAMWSVLNGSCAVDADKCLISPNFPASYGNSNSCRVVVDPRAARPIRVANFSTEEYYDALQVNCRSFSGSAGPEGMTPESMITWSADDSNTGAGWRLCPDGAPY